MSDREAIIPEGMEAVYENIHYAPAVRVGNTLYVSGQIGRNAAMQLVEGKEAQFVQVFENLKTVLATAGLEAENFSTSRHWRRGCEVGGQGWRPCK